MAREALNREQEILALHDGGELVGIASLSAGPQGHIGIDELKGNLEVTFLATKRRGYGRQMMERLRERCEGRGYGVLVSSSAGARDFYEAIGMKLADGTTNKFYWESSRKDEVDTFNLEPKDGIFTEVEREDGL